MFWDLVIIGAGPAGMSAAIEASKRNLTVLVLDRQSTPGGQIFRSVGEASVEKRKALGKDYARGADLVASFRSSSASYHAGANVWHVAPGRVCYSLEGKSHTALASQVLIATGGMERPVPVDGWTLPGIMGAGASDVLLKSASLLPEGPVILCGNGPLILQAVAHLKHFKVPIAGVVFTNDLKNIVRATPKVFGAFARPRYLLHGIGMGLGMALRARCYYASRNVSITKNDSTFTISFTSFGKQKSLTGTTVLLHEGVIAESRITHLARLDHTWNARQRYWHVTADVWGATSISGIRCAGDTAGVRGADAAMALGRLAALDICHELGRLSHTERDSEAKNDLCALGRQDMMQPFMDTVFSPVPECLQPADNALVCRCEELTAKELRKAILEGNYSPDGLKAQTRCGMGTCQGRMCSASVAEMIAQVHNIPLERLNPYHAQAPLFPLSLRELAAMRIPYEGL